MRPDVDSGVVRPRHPFTGWGRASTDRSGHYSFTTLVPGAPFFAITVFARGLLDRLFTRAYLPEASDAFLEGLDAAAERLSNFVGKAAQATLVGEVFDDAATGQGLLNYFLRAINCGAVSEADAARRTGLTLEELRGRSFLRILQARRGAATR